MKFTSSSYPVVRAAARPIDRGAPTFPPAFLAMLGITFLVAGGDVSLSLGLILAALVWFGLLLVVELRGAPTPRPEGR